MYALKNANVYTIVRGYQENQVVIIEEGKIKEIGENVEIPENIPVYDMSGKYITPGFIDAHCHVGVYNEGTGEPGADGNEWCDPVTPHVKSADGIYTDDEAFADALAHGVTALCITPGSANVVCGQMAVVKPKSNILEEMMITDYVGLKCAFGENPKNVHGSQKKMPTTRMGVASVLRRELHNAFNYKTKKEFELAKPAEEGKEKQPFEKDFVKECYLPVLEKKIPLRAHAHRMDDIQTAVRIAEEFGLKIVIEHCTEGYKIADYLAKKGIPAVLGPYNGTKSKVELRHMSLEAPRIMEEAGVKFALMTDAPVQRIGSLFDDVRLFIRHGLSECAALKAVTEVPAELLGLSHRLGSVEAGKDADLNVFDGEPFDFRSKIETVIIEGKVHFGELK
ncbi:MAG: amidohydrolase [Candidatus Cloacimonadota bacterium]|nr:MAG: amidohydrolase [Candidatus Cloacimonadota bacterium]